MATDTTTFVLAMSKANDPHPSLRFDRAQWEYEKARDGGVAPLWKWEAPSADEYCQAIDDYLAGKLSYDDCKTRRTYSREYCVMRNIGRY